MVEALALAVVEAPPPEPFDSVDPFRSTRAFRCKIAASSTGLSIDARL